MNPPDRPTITHKTDPPEVFVKLSDDRTVIIVPARWRSGLVVLYVDPTGRPHTVEPGHTLGV